jgi:hypothetical protein
MCDVVCAEMSIKFTRLKKVDFVLWRCLFYFFVLFFVLLFGASETGVARSANGTRLMLRMEFYSVLLATDGLQFDRAVFL